MQPDKENKTKERVFFRKRDIAILLAVVVAAGIFYGVWQHFAKPGAVAQITVLTPGGQQQSYTLPLNTDTLYTVPGTEFPVTLQVENGRVRFVDSQCPDHLCEGFGWLENEGEEAICLPAGVWVRVVQQP